MPLLVLLTLPALLAGESLWEQVDVFTAGHDGYHTFRIPAIVTTSDGTLIAFAEARKENRSDPGGGDIDLVYRRSTDRGKTWSPLRVLDDPGEGWGASNPTPVADRDSGRVWILYNRWEPGFGTERSQPGTSNNQAWARHSDDNGATWSEAVDLTRVSRAYDHWGAMFLGPGGAIQARDGRLIVPAAMKPDIYSVWMSIGGFEGRTSLMRAYALTSDDHGDTWKRGELVKAQTNENQLVELSDGPSACRRLSSAIKRRTAFAKARVSPGDTRTPVSPSRMRSMIWPIPTATTARPQAMYSSTFKGE